MDFHIRRLTSRNLDEARELFALMSAVFDEPAEVLSDEYLESLLNHSSFWTLAAFHGPQIIGGLTAHEIPMTRKEISELLLFDIAVTREHQRKGIGSRLLDELSALASQSGILDTFVLADADDTHALDFYHRNNGRPSDVVLFSFTAA